MLKPSKTIRQRRGSLGFTAIELLVSIALVGALAAALIPALSNGRAAARQATCLSNQRSLGFGYASYIENENQYIPESGNTGNSENYGWEGGAAYGTWHAWCPYGTYWSTDVYIPNPNNSGWPTSIPTTKSTEVGIGLVYRYLSGFAPTPTSGSDPVGRLFYCPGTTASFNSGPAYGDQYDGERAVFPGKSWYTTWTYGFGTAPDLNDSGKGGTNITYYYRNGAYYTEDHPSTTASWSWSFKRHASDPGLQNKAILGCFSPTGDGYTAQDPAYPAWLGGTASVLNTAYLAHGGNKLNILMSDGSAHIYRPSVQNGVAFNQGLCGFFDYTAQNEADYFLDGTNLALDPNYAFGQVPWFWVMADQRR